MNDALERLKAEIAALRRNRRRGRVRPHKLLLLLAVLDMAEEGLLRQNRIHFDDSLITRFARHFESYQQADDLCQPAPPYFHLRSSHFWHHKVISGKEAAYAKMDTSGGGSKRILDTIEYAYLSNYAFEIVQEERSRRELRAFIENILNSEG